MGQGTGKLISKAGVEVRAGNARIGRVKSVSIADSKGVTTITDMDLLAGEIADKITGARDVSVSLTVNVVASDPGYVAARSAYKSGTLTELSVTGISRDGTVTWAESYEGEYSQFNTDFNEDGVATSAIIFQPSDILTAE